MYELFYNGKGCNFEKVLSQLYIFDNILQQNTNENL